MTFKTKTLGLAVALSLMAAPALASHDGTGHVPENTPPGYSGNQNPGTENGLSRSEARALGRKECQQFKRNFSENRSQFG